MVKSLSWRDLELGRELGSGKAGTVYMATLKVSFRELTKGTVVAVKKYGSWVREQSGSIDRIYREYSYGAKNIHPNIVESYSLLDSATDGLGLVMKYYSGETLSAFLRKWRKEKNRLDPQNLPPVGECFTYLCQIGMAISALHKRGVTHRDVKPENIMISDGKAILMDLGVIDVDLAPDQTSFGQVLGSIRYSASEYLFGGKYDNTIDIYSLVAIAYELFFGIQYYYNESVWSRLILLKGKEMVGDVTDKNFVSENTIFPAAYPVTYAESDFLRKHYTPSKLYNLVFTVFSLGIYNRKNLIAFLETVWELNLWESPYYSNGKILKPGRPSLIVPGRKEPYKRIGNF